MKHLATSPPRFPDATAALLSCSLLVTGCSGSGTSDVDSIEATSDSTNPVLIDDGDGNTPPGTSNGAVSRPPVGTVNAPNSEPTPPIPAVDNPAVADSLTPATTRVDFNVVVPAYQSNELRVIVVWGDVTLTAHWIGDESWSATAELPAELDGQLSVTFYDRNGDVELAQYTQAFRTGANAAQSLQITADQFDASQYDTDGDGISNLDESIAGRDPTIDEDASLEIREYFALSSWSRMSVSDSLEARVPDERPISASLDSTPDDPDLEGSTTGSVSIDENGNGTLNYRYVYYSCTNQRVSGTRTVLDNAVSWDAEYATYDCDYGFRVNVFNTVTVADDTTRQFTEDTIGSNIGTYTYRWETSTRLTGELVAGTSLCRPVAGTVSTIYRTEPGGGTRVTTVSREPDDRYWRVVTVTNETDTAEYLARELRILQTFNGSAAAADPVEANFICEFVDL